MTDPDTARRHITDDLRATGVKWDIPEILGAPGARELRLEPHRDEVLACARAEQVRDEQVVRDRTWAGMMQWVESS